MKALNLLLITSFLVSFSSAGVLDFLSRKRASWEFIQKTGGIEISDFEYKGSLPVMTLKYDVTGMTPVTRKPELLNSGIVVSSVRANVNGRNIYIEIYTSTPSRKATNKVTHEVELNVNRPGDYKVFYGNGNQADQRIGTISLK